MNITDQHQSPNYIRRIKPGRGAFIDAIESPAEVLAGDVLVKSEEGPWFAQYRKIEQPEEPQQTTPDPSDPPDSSETSAPPESSEPETTTPPESNAPENSPDGTPEGSPADNTQPQD